MAAASERDSSYVEVVEPEDDDDDLDAESTPHSLSRALYRRRAEYTRPHSMRIKVGTWNVAACPGVERDIKEWFVDGRGVGPRPAMLHPAELHDDTEEGAQRARASQETTRPRPEQDVVGGDQVGLYVLGLQEIVTLASAKEYIGKVYVDSTPLNRWKETLAGAVPEGYELVAATQMSGLLLLIYASPAVAPSVSSVSSVCVGTGIMGYLRNKGAVSTRIVLGETTRLVFVNSHLASGVDKTHLQRRCWDAAQILARTRFEPVDAGMGGSQEEIDDADFAFWIGDLNFRLDGLPGDDIRRLLMLHTKGEYDVRSKRASGSERASSDSTREIHHVDSDDDESVAPQAESIRASISDDGYESQLPDPDEFAQDPHMDPASLQATLDSLLPHDQLRRMQRQRRVFHDGWREGPITFLPTYKYDVGAFGVFDSGEKRRPPSWCDRILFRTRQDKLAHEEKMREEEETKRRDEDMRARGIAEAAQAEEVIFDYDPASDAADVAEYDEYDEDEAEAQEDAAEEVRADALHLDVYTSHQRVMSSDHKPLDAVFTLHYDAAVPELKSAVRQEVAWELDRAENEQRPGITILVDLHAVAEDPSAPTPTTADAAEGVNFGDAAFLQRKERALTIANTGQVPACFAFIARPVEPGQPEQIKPSWLHVAFTSEHEHSGTLEKQVTLQPGETATTRLEVYVEEVAQATALNRGEMLLDDVLILRVADGRDYFVPVRATWRPSCFGRSIDELIRIPQGGAWALPPPRQVRGDGAVGAGAEVRRSAPRELFRLTEAIGGLVERAVADRGMMDEGQGSADGWPFEAERGGERGRRAVLDALESDGDLAAAFPLEAQAAQRLEVLCETLLLFLGSITDGVVPAPLWAQVDAELARRPALDAEETRALVLDVLSASPNHHISLVFLMAMLAAVLNEVAPVSGAGSAAGTERKGLAGLRQSIYGRRGVGGEAVARRAVVRRRFAELVGEAVVRGADRKGRRRDVVEAFLERA